MSFASDKLYNGYLRRNMPTIVSRVKVREIMIHLPCLTLHDRENIEAKREICGNYDGMVLLLDCLKRRESWPEQFIEALEACEQTVLAAGIRAEYDTLRGTNNSNPSSPPTTVIRAHVHPAPSASPLSIPETGANSQDAAAAPAPPAEAPAPTPPAEAPAPAPPAEAPAPTPPAEAPAPPEPSASPLSIPESDANSQAAAPAPPAEAPAPPEPSASPLSIPESDANSQAAAPAPPAEAPAPPESSASPLSIPETHSQAAPAPPAEAPAPPEPALQASPPLEIPVQPQAPQSSAFPEAVSPPEPPQPSQCEVEPPLSTPPPSPETTNTQATTTPPPKRELNSHQEPVENSESDIQGVFGDDALIPDQVSAGDSEVSIDSVAPSQPPCPVEQLETDTPSLPDPRQTTTTSTEVSPPRSPSPTQINSDQTDGSSFLTVTPEKPPVQDTTPPVDLKPAPVLQPEETSEPPATQVIESSPQTETAATPSPLPGAAAMDASFCDDSSVCMSKPGQLLSIHPQRDVSPAIPEPSVPVQPYSGNSERLEISDAAPDPVTSAHLSLCSTTVTTASALPCQENGIALTHIEPEENHYESPCQSLERQDVLQHVVHVSEEPSILDLDGQSPIPQAQIMNGEAAKEITSAPPLSTNTVDTVSSVNTPSSENSEPAPADKTPEPMTLPNSEKRSSNTKYILTAAGVGACALLMAWRFKN